MKINVTILSFLLLGFTSISAQIEQVAIGPNYSQQAYYSLESGEVQTIANDSWDIAFSAYGQQDAGVFINESTTFMNNPIQVFLTESDDWSETIINTENFVDTKALYNPELNWTEGAFNTIKNPNSPFDFGWGSYSPQTNTVEGDKIFVIKKRNGTFIKFQVMSLAGGTYTFRYANLDGSNEKISSVSKSDVNGPLIYFSIDSEEMIEEPTEYDLIFQRYTTALDDGEGNFIEYTVTGVLLAPNTKAVVALGVDPSNVFESDYSDQYSSLPTTIGHNWKSFDFQSGWLIDFERTQFVKTASGDIYQMTFFDFEGSSTGNTTFEKKFITSVSLEDKVYEKIEIAVYPNPTTEYFYLKSDSHKNLKVSILDSNGRKIRDVTSLPNTPIYITELSSGIYNIMTESDDMMSVQRLVVR